MTLFPVSLAEVRIGHYVLLHGKTCKVIQIIERSDKLIIIGTDVISNMKYFKKDVKNSLLIFYTPILQHVEILEIFEKNIKVFKLETFRKVDEWIHWYYPHYTCIIEKPINFKDVQVGDEIYLFNVFQQDEKTTSSKLSIVSLIQHSLC